MATDTMAGIRIRRIIFILPAVAIATAALGFAVFYWSAVVPTPEQMRAGQVTTLYAADDHTVLDTVAPATTGRTVVTLPDIPPTLRAAVLAAEDRDFYRNPGFSVTGFLRATRDNLTGNQEAGGGSTITQQYVRNALLSPQRTLTRKMRELVIATKMARQWSKDDILDAYLNTIYFGRGAYGISDAADAYFDKPVSTLNTAEGAVLAAVIRAPSRLSLDDRRDELTARWNYVLDGMVSTRTLDPADRATLQFPALVPAHPNAANTAPNGPEGLIRTRVLAELSAANIPDRAMGGLRITTTIDLRTQRAAREAVMKHLRGQPDSLRSAVVSIDPHSGAVRGYYGGRNGVGFDFAAAGLQTGSAFKVFGLVAALQNGLSLSTPFDSAPLTDHGITIRNADGESCGTCSLAQALKQSLNTSYYRLAKSLGPQSIADAAHQAGIPTTIPGIEGKSLSERNGPPLPGIVLGQYLVRPIDMASAFATLAASGNYHPPHFVQKVADSAGHVLLDRNSDNTAAGQQRITKYVADSVTSAMIPIAAYSNHHELAGHRPSAAKTGTTQLGTTRANKDAWMVGYTPQLCTAVWIGTEHATAIHTSSGADIYGAGLPADIWAETMNLALTGFPPIPFPEMKTDQTGLFVGGESTTPKPGRLGPQSGDPLFGPGPAPRPAPRESPEDPLFTPRNPTAPTARTSEPDPIIGSPH